MRAGARNRLDQHLPRASCARLLRRERHRAGLRPAASPSTTRTTSWRIIKRAMRRAGHRRNALPAGASSRHLSNAKNAAARPAQSAEQGGRLRRRSPPGLPALPASAHAAGNAMDFDDLLMLTVAACSQRRPERARQATSAASATSWWTSSRTPTSPRSPGASCSRRDDAQHRAWWATTTSSIYWWRGADIRNILELRARLPGREGGPAGAELPLRAEDPRRGQRGHHQEPQRKDKNMRTDRGRGCARPGRGSQRRARRGPVRRQRGAKLSRGGQGRRAGRTGRGGGALPHRRAEPRARGAVRALCDRLPGHRRTKFYERAEIRDLIAYLTIS